MSVIPARCANSAATIGPPDNDELLFWAGLSLAGQGDVSGGTERIRRAIEVHAGWRELLDRLGEDIAPSVGVVREALDRRR